MLKGVHFIACWLLTFKQGVYGLHNHDEAAETLSHYGYKCLPFTGYSPESKKDIQHGIFVASLLPVVQWDFDFIDDKKHVGLLSVLFRVEGLYCNEFLFILPDTDFWLFCPQFDDGRYSKSLPDACVMTNLVSTVKASTSLVHSQVSTLKFLNSISRFYLS